jgi:UDP-N-acetylglucosamine 2-epimerase (non-hydrolysing)
MALQGICQAVLALAKAHPDVTFVFPVHLNPNVRKVVFSRYFVNQLP